MGFWDQKESKYPCSLSGLWDEDEDEDEDGGGGGGGGRPNPRGVVTGVESRVEARSRSANEGE